MKVVTTPTIVLTDEELAFMKSIDEGLYYFCMGISSPEDCFKCPFSVTHGNSTNCSYSLFMNSLKTATNGNFMPINLK